MNELIELLRQLEATKFYGAVEVKFESGHITVIKKTESIRPSQDHRTNRGQVDERSQSR